mmetsp:Transcript_265/g.562  ORF Transcript_265/g.562 Transcript_265/m.562 type:complete len:280 (-) Transcript_265:566-1405(-)
MAASAVHALNLASHCLARSSRAAHSATTESPTRLSATASRRSLATVLGAGGSGPHRAAQARARQARTGRKRLSVAHSSAASASSTNASFRQRRSIRPGGKGVAPGAGTTGGFCSWGASLGAPSGRSRISRRVVAHTARCTASFHSLIPSTATLNKETSFSSHFTPDASSSRFSRVPSAGRPVAQSAGALVGHLMGTPCLSARHSAHVNVRRFLAPVTVSPMHLGWKRSWHSRHVSANSESDGSARHMHQRSCAHDSVAAADASSSVDPEASWYLWDGRR